MSQVHFLDTVIVIVYIVFELHAWYCVAQKIRNRPVLRSSHGEKCTLKMVLKIKI